MANTSAGSGGVQRHSTTLVYVKTSGRVLHVSHLDAMEGSALLQEFVAGVQENALDEACHIHGALREDLAVVSLDPKEFKHGLIYSVDPATGGVATRPVRP